MIRGLVVAASLAVIGAATHANIVHAGGYGSENAPLAIAIALLLSVGIGFATVSWREGSRGLAVVLSVCLVAGEAYWLLTNAEREIAARELAAAPLRAAAEQRTEASTRVTEAAQRLDRAEQAKATADAASINKAAEIGCKTNCANLLMSAQATAEHELAEARQAVIDARSALAVLPPPLSADPLPARIGMAGWAWDLVLAGLRAMAIMGASVALALAMHSKRAEPDTKAQVTAPSAPERIQILEIIEPRRLICDRDHLARFLQATIQPDPSAAASLRELHARYLTWCNRESVAPLPPEALGLQFRSLLGAVGLECEHTGRDVVTRGAAIAT